MGLTDSLFAGLGQAVGSVVGIAGGLSGGGTGPGGIVGDVVAPVTGVVSAPAEIVGGAVGAVTDVVGGAVGAATGLVGAVAGAPPAVDTTGFGGGNGMFATRTIVETMNLQTGDIVRRRILPGSPHIMNSEIQAAKKVFRQAAKLQKRIPRKTVRESKTTQLKDAAVDAAIRQANKDCPSS